MLPCCPLNFRLFLPNISLASSRPPLALHPRDPPQPGNKAALDSLVTVNPVYTGAIGVAFGQQTAMQAYLTASLWATIARNLYQGDMNPALTAMRLFSFPAYYTAAAGILQGMSISPQQQWSNFSGGSNALTGALLGFEVKLFESPAAGPLTDAQAALLLGGSSAVSLLTPAGLALWLAFLSAPSSNSGLAAFGTIALALELATASGYANGQQATLQVAAYLGNKMLNTTSAAAAAYLGLCTQALFVGAGVAVPTGAEAPTSWTDLGAYQFSTCTASIIPSFSTQLLTLHFSPHHG